MAITANPQTFAVLSLDNPEILAIALVEKYPQDHFRLSANQWLLVAPGTAKEVCDNLGITGGTVGSADSGKSTVPTKFPETTPPLPSGDYSYILEIVMNMQVTMGKLTEAVDSLKTQSNAQGEKIEHVARDIHAAKVVIGVVGGLIVAVGTFLGVVINALAQYLASHPAK